MGSAALPLAVTCGQLIVAGFAGTSVPESFASSLAAGHTGGAIFFRRNLTDDLAQIAELSARVGESGRTAFAAPLVAVDQEGGRVARLPSPALKLPPMLALARRGDVAFFERLARAQARELAALGFTMNFAPVLDVNTNPDNPIIGDRTFGDEPNVVARFGAAYVRGLQDGGVLACGKHFPGHGDTSKDSHLELPSVSHDRARLDEVELVPFRAAIAAGVAAIMTAHIVCPSLDERVPATLSRATCTTLLREQLGFTGVIVSDDLEMKAISDHYGIEEAAVSAIEAGCDVLLVCSDEALQARAHEALVRKAELDTRFRSRCEDAASRALAMRARFPPRPMLSVAEIRGIVGGDESKRMADEVARVMA